MLPALLALPLVACNSQDAADLKRDVGQVTKTAVRAAGNAQLVGRVNAQLAQRKGIDMSGFRVSGKGGTITVEGHVRTAGEKALVLKEVDGIRGVEKVVDKLRVEKAKSP